jgi:hypothetical protein
MTGRAGIAADEDVVGKRGHGRLDRETGSSGEATSILSAAMVLTASATVKVSSRSNRDLQCPWKN